MRVAAAKAREAGADLIDLNMGCPVRKVCKTGAGASLLKDPGKAVAIARAAREGSGLPVTVKLRSGLEPGDRSGFELARRLVEDAGVAGIGFHPRHASQQHKGLPDYDLASELASVLPAPVMLTGGLGTADKAREAYERTGVAAVLVARGSLGNPWIFEQLLGIRNGDPSVEEITYELMWVIDRAEEHFGTERAGRWLRKAYPWYSERLGLPKKARQALCESQTTQIARQFLATGNWRSGNSEGPIGPSATLPALSYA
jgi:tRNA-dihydrouridine synthase